MEFIMKKSEISYPFKKHCIIFLNYHLGTVIASCLFNAKSLYTFIFSYQIFQRRVIDGDSKKKFLDFFSI